MSKTSKPKQKETNVEFIERMMDFSKHVALTQLVILTAIEKYADAIAARPVETIEAMKGSPINGNAWVSACAELKAELDKHLAS